MKDRTAETIMAIVCAAAMAMTIFAAWVVAQWMRLK